MTPRHFADLAASVSRHAEALSAAGGPTAVALHRVWKRSSRCFRQWREELVTAATPRLYADLFAAELPLRVWCTAAAAGTTRADGAGPAMAAKIFGELLETRCMTLQALAADHGLTTAEAAAVDRFRRRCERWADVLVGPVLAASGVTDFAVNPERAADFGAECDESSQALADAGLQLAFAPAELFRGPAEPRDSAAAAQLAAAILTTFPTEAFGSDGALRSPAVARAARVVEERRPGKVRRRAPRPGSLPPAASAEAPVLEKSPVETRPTAAISFASLRKRPPTA